MCNGMMKFWSVMIPRLLTEVAGLITTVLRLIDLKQSDLIDVWWNTK